MKDLYIEKKIYYHDTDCGGVVYYANYLKFLEEGRSEYCAAKGIDLKELVEEGTYFVVAHVELNYKAPARYADTLKVYTKVEKKGSASIDFAQSIMRGEQLLVDSKTVWVCVGRDMKPQPIPDNIKSLF